MKHTRWKKKAAAAAEKAAAAAEKAAAEALARKEAEGASELKGLEKEEQERLRKEAEDAALMAAAQKEAEMQLALEAEAARRKAAAERSARRAARGGSPAPGRCAPRTSAAPARGHL